MIIVAMRLYIGMTQIVSEKLHHVTPPQEALREKLQKMSEWTDCIGLREHQFQSTKMIGYTFLIALTVIILLS